MKYVKNLDDFKRYTFEFFDTFLPQDLSDKMVNYLILDLGDREQLINSVMLITQKNPPSESAVVEFGEVLLQIVENRDYLKKFVELLLITKSYEQLSAFLNSIFSGQIGDTKYHSHYHDYTIYQRYFDRFIEIINYCDIDKSLFSPFFLEILGCDQTSKMFDYKEPLKEYLDVFVTDDKDDEFVSELLFAGSKFNKNDKLEFDDLKAIKNIIYDYATNEFNSLKIIKQVLLKKRQESYNILEELFKNEVDNENIDAFRLVQMLVVLSEDKFIQNKLKKLYDETDDKKIKAYLERECGFNSLKRFSSKETFLIFVDNSVKQIQERLFGARLKRYYEKYQLDNTGINGKVLTFVMEFFKSRETDSQLKDIKNYFEFVDKETLSKLARVVYEVAKHRSRLVGSKWTIRLIAVFGDIDLIKEMTAEVKSWCEQKQNQAYCKYFLSVIVGCKRDDFIQIIKDLKSANLTNKQLKMIEEELKTFSNNNKENIEDVKDKLVENFEFDINGQKIILLNSKELRLQINPNCKITYFNNSTNKPARIKPNETYQNISLKDYIKRLEKHIKEQKKRLFNAFLEFRNYSPEMFKECILDNNLLNFLSQHLFWGRYRGDKLVEICLLKDNKLVHAAGNLVVDNFDNYTIALCQAMDCEDVKNTIRYKIEPLFNQFDMPIFSPDSLRQNLNYVDNLNGVFCNAQLFITRLQKLKYKINDLDYDNNFGTLVKENQNLNLVTCVEFNKVNLKNLDTSTTISKIRFYDLSRQIKNGKIYSLQKANALEIRELNPKVVSNEIALVLLASKN